MTDGHGGTATATVTIQVAVPADVGIEMLRSRVDELTLNRGQKALLKVELDLAARCLERGRPRLAAVQLHLFVRHVGVLVRIGRLDAATADALCTEAESLIDVIA